MRFNIKNRFSGDVQFTAEIEAEEGAATSLKISLAVKWAMKNGANLSFADLRYADLHFADLSSANLRSADLSFADLSTTNLSFADLSSANLSFADLSSANLSFADLRYANLSSADLSSANLSSADLRILQTNIWTVYIQKENIRIGCKNYAVDEWVDFSDEDISLMDTKALDWWRGWKPIIMGIHEVLVIQSNALKDAPVKEGV